VNADYFSNKSTAFSIIVKQLASKAAENIFPFIYKFNGRTPRLSMIAQLLDHLREFYLDYNLKEKANVEFGKLIIRNTDRF
ncbi:hypothetical protein QR685DRAFT_444290, partial [Neurospora intermedia]